MSKSKKQSDRDLQNDARERTVKCAAAIDAVLKKHRCVLEATVIINHEGVHRSITIVPLP